jgi:hypothetical protein
LKNSSYLNSRFDVKGQKNSLLVVEYVMGNGSVPRECTIAARDKLLAETGLDKIKMIRGWIIDFRHLRGVSLPKNKYVALTEHGKDLTSGMSSAAKELETMIGHLGPISLSGGARHS